MAEKPNKWPINKREGVSGPARREYVWKSQLFPSNNYEFPIFKVNSRFHRSRDRLTFPVHPIAEAVRKSKTVHKGELKIWSEIA